MTSFPHRPFGRLRIAVAPVALGLAIVLAAIGARAAETLPYLFDQLKKPAYKAPLVAILRGQRLPGWIPVFMRTMNGVTNPGSLVTVEGQQFELYSVCEPHNCGGNFLYVLYTPGGGRAFALVTKDGKVLTVLGNPSPAERQALMEGTQQ